MDFFTPGLGEISRQKARSLQCRCRSELAREELIGAAFTQASRVIVGVSREQARSCSGSMFPLLNSIAPDEQAYSFQLESHIMGL